MRERMVDGIIEILKKVEPDLSDGYGHYCDPVDDKLREIAEDIVDKVEKEWKR